MPLLPIANVPPPWFFGVSALIEPGAVLLPGNWLRVVRVRAALGFTDAVDQVAYEQVFEEIRLKEAPTAPSRLSCLFVCPDRAALDRFRAEQRHRTDVIYRVEPVEGLETVFVGRWTLWNWREIKEGTTLKARKSARRYWTETASGAGREVLVPCPVRILERI